MQPTDGQNPERHSERRAWDVVQGDRAPSAGATRLGVLGWPVAHSRSPAMQNAALRAAGLTTWRYQLLPVPPQLFVQTTVALAPAGFRGANVTIPHKQAALALADQPSPRAAAIGAANTLLFEPDGTIRAENTDAPAIVAVLPFDNLRGRTALVLGAGGSARAAVWALLDAGAQEVRVWNRTAARASALADELDATAVEHAEPADVLVHCTSAGLHRPEEMFAQLPLGPAELGDYGCVIDLVYATHETPLIAAARQRGVPAADGLSVLVAQGALAFELFTGLPAPVEVMTRALTGG